MKVTTAVVAFLAVAGSAAAQTAQPFAGLQNRPIKALSTQEIGDLRAARGMGLALAAELNGYPGPSHVLDLGDRLELSQDQRARIEGLLARMKAETLPLGEKLIAQEAELDRQFASHAASAESVLAATQAIGVTRGTLRGSHLKYHLAMLEILTPVQVERYGELRGYRDAGQPQPQPQHQHRQ